MDRRHFIYAAGALGLLPWAARAQARPLRYADMHSHVGFGNRDSIREGMAKNGMLLVARKYISDYPVIRMMVGGYGAHRVATPGELGCHIADESGDAAGEIRGVPRADEHDTK